MQGSHEAPPDGPGVTLIPPSTIHHPAAELPVTGFDLTGGGLVIGLAAIATGAVIWWRARRA